jgi:hypothetical protein
MLLLPALPSDALAALPLASRLLALELRGLLGLAAALAGEGGEDTLR